jgi:hypothetical protein
MNFFFNKIIRLEKCNEQCAAKDFLIPDRSSVIPAPLFRKLNNVLWQKMTWYQFYYWIDVCQSTFPKYFIDGDGLIFIIIRYQEYL